MDKKDVAVVQEVVRTLVESGETRVRSEVLAAEQRTAQRIDRAIESVRDMVMKVVTRIGLFEGNIAPTMSGYPAVFESDWCGEHKLVESEVRARGGDITNRGLVPPTPEEYRAQQWIPGRDRLGSE